MKPVMAWVLTKKGTGNMVFFTDEDEVHKFQNYTRVHEEWECTPLVAQREWVGLTDEVIWLEYQRLWPFHPAEEPTLAKDIAKFAKAIEAKLKQKNEQQNQP